MGKGDYSIRMRVDSVIEGKVERQYDYAHVGFGLCSVEPLGFGRLTIP